MLPLLTIVSLFTVSGLIMPGNSKGHLISVPTSTNQDESGSGRMPSIVFKTQDYCRSELPDFEFDIRFDVVGATVMFLGANFNGVETGFITSNSLKPVKHLMNRCLPGSIVVFDDVKVKGPDNLVRKIPGISLSLY